MPPRVHSILDYDICTMLDQRRRRWADVVQMFYKLGLCHFLVVEFHSDMLIFAPAHYN